ncbi:hypothetical protein [Pseudoflavitalea rhizosphaerae]|uniref:hypothetical protein n=1 Tax=Pseudoflavitalea rhizosphaerae TaxID=1884793 RepID=UPI000F8CE770|nr:hypothetical protein [Pseudoflavitalea rhizosphaerae]
MARFSITKLEEARNNPQRFAESLTETKEDQKFFPRSKFADWQRAAIFFHDGDNLSGAIKKLTTVFTLNYKESIKNQKELEQLVVNLENYAHRAEKRGLTLFDKRRNIRIDINADLLMTGQIPLIYMNDKGGYAASFFQKQTTFWQDELKYPIIQHHIAESLLGCDVKTVEVGIYSLEDEDFSLKTYSKKAINDAIEELKDLGDSIVSYM